MATTSLWRIKGSMGRVVDYVENADKTTAPIAEPAEASSETLENLIAYAGREEATNLRKLITGIQVDPERAREQMMNVKEAFEKTGGTIAYHGYQSFAEGEVTPELAHTIGVKLAEELWGDRYQVLVCTHLDKASHIHNHFLINTVSFVDGIKFHRTNEDYRRMQQVSDRLCREYGLSVVRHPEHSGKNYGQWLAEKNGKPTYASTIRADIDRAIGQSLTEREFYDRLEDMGYELKFYAKSGKILQRPSLRPKGSKKFFRFDNLGENYNVDEIADRILENIRREVPFPEEEMEKVRKYRKEHPPHTKVTGLAALYYHYCYELHIIVHYPASVQRVSFFMREDIRKLDRLDAQVRFLGENHISTYEDLTMYREATEQKIEKLKADRTWLRNKLKRIIRGGNETMLQSVKLEIREISAQIDKLRDSLVTCDSVEQRSAQMQKELADLKQQTMEQTEEKEEITDELLRRSGGTGRSNVTERH